MNRITVISRWLPPISLTGYARKLIESATGQKRYAIHAALLRNTMLGLEKIRAASVYEPPRRRACSESVLLMGCHANLKWLSQAKRSGTIKKLIIGPMLARATGSDFSTLSAYREHLDAIIAPSEYYGTRILESAPWLSPDKLKIWPVGIDTRKFQRGKTRSKILIYQKRAPTQLLEQVTKLLHRKKLEFILLEYGSYSIVDYQRALEQSHTAIFLSPMESQGIALGESWASDVPTYCWLSSRNKSRPYSAPLLSGETGRFFYDVNELTALMNEEALSGLKPRDWVDRNLSLETQARALVSLFSSIPQ